MKRDWNLIKELLLRIECLELGHHFATCALAQHCPQAVEDHLRLMHHAGLIECSVELPEDGKSELVAHTLTPAGRDLLDAILDSDSRKYLLHSHAASCARTVLSQTT